MAYKYGQLLANFTCECWDDLRHVWRFIRKGLCCGMISKPVDIMEYPTDFNWRLPLVLLNTAGELCILV